MNYIPFHVHSDLSLLDSITSFNAYIDRAKELGIKAMAFTEHGNVYNWMQKKEYMNKNGIKYIHGAEFYLTETLSEKIRDNYHIILLAKNWDGVKEINKLSSISWEKDGHFYYDPRITLKELFNTSDNVIITSACLSGLLWKAREKKELCKRFIDFFVQNKHRCFFEIQYHNMADQKTYNEFLCKLSAETGVRLIAGTDTHAIDKKHLEGRKILMQAKNIQYGFEEQLDLTFKSYQEIIEEFKKQGCLPEKVYSEAISNTNMLYDMVDDFEIDRSHKYPRIFKNPEKTFINKIKNGIKDRGLDNLSAQEKKEYNDRIKFELETYKALNAIDYILFQEDVISYGKSKGIYPGPGRGSVSGSLIAFLLGITELDSVKHGLNFVRFLNPSRVTLADIDVDYPPSRRQEIIDYVANKDGIYFSEIITFNTIALKGAIREVGRALKIDLKTIDEISDNVEDKEQYYRDKYPKLFEYVDLLNGTTVSVGSHPSGFLVSPIPLDENVGLFYTSKSKYPVAQLNMKELDGACFVKLDILGLENVEIINETCALAGIERLTPCNVPDDPLVWEDMTKDNIGIFQMESDFAFSVLKKIFSKEVINKIKESIPEIKNIELLSMGSGAIRPSGESYRENLCQGITNDNGHEALNKLLAKTLGYCIYQEDIIAFLNQFCGFSMGEADIVRRFIAKKTGDMDLYLPKIKSGFINFMKSKYSMDEKYAEEILQSFLKVIEDASGYGFSINHSLSYSYIGYINGYLRYYYPYEFITAMLNSQNETKISRIAAYAKKRGIKILPIKFRKSIAKYNYSKEDQAIYEGLQTIKYLNSQIADELYALKDKQYKSFIDLLVDLHENTSINSKQLKILTTLNFFDEFGTNLDLLNIIDEFLEGDNKYKKTYVEQTKQKRLSELKKLEQTILLNRNKLSLINQIKFEKEYLGYTQIKIESASKSDAIVLDVDEKFTPKVTLYYLKNGEEKVVKLSKAKYYKNGETSLMVGDIVKVKKIVEKNKWKKTDTGFKQVEDEFEDWLESFVVTKRIVDQSEYNKQFGIQ